MTGRERVRKTLAFQYPDRVPRSLWYLPGVEDFRKKDLDEVLETYPMDIVHVRPDFCYRRGKKVKGERYKSEQVATDEWGCEWHTVQEGVAGEVKSYPLKDLSDVKNLEAPYEIFEGADWTKVDTFCSNTDQFVVAWTTVRPFERMQFLIGTEKLFIELTNPSKELHHLRDVLHSFFMEEMRLWGKTKIDGIMFMDDWGWQQQLLISPKLWRDFFKPLYRNYCDLIHGSNKSAFFHSDGNIMAIYNDLIEVGIDAINSQLFCMDIEGLGAKYKGKITFWGEIDRQHILPFGTQNEVRNAVRRVTNALGSPAGGVIAHCEFGLKDPTENIKTVFETWQSL
jgi:hypothetical protein